MNMVDVSQMAHILSFFKDPSLLIAILMGVISTILSIRLLVPLCHLICF